MCEQTKRGKLFRSVGVWLFLCPTSCPLVPEQVSSSGKTRCVSVTVAWDVLGMLTLDWTAAEREAPPLDSRVLLERHVKWKIAMEVGREREVHRKQWSAALMSRQPQVKRKDEHIGEAPHKPTNIHSVYNKHWVIFHRILWVNHHLTQVSSAVGRWHHCKHKGVGYIMTHCPYS